MKLRVTLKQPNMMADRDLQIVADGTATVGDVARAIGATGEIRHAIPDEELTLRRIGTSEALTSVLEPDLSLLHSGIASGSAIGLASAREARPGDRGMAVLRVVDGPDKGTEVHLRAGTSTIGRSSLCDVRLTDPRVSKKHARVFVSDHVEVIDNNSGNGIIAGGVRVGTAKVGPGDTVRLGSTTISIDLTGNAALTSSIEIEFNRSPVVLERPRANEVDPPEMPMEQPGMPFPWLMMVAPVIMGGVFYLVTRSVMSIMFVAMSPILLAGNYLSQSMARKKAMKKAREVFERDLQSLDETLVAAGDDQRKKLMALFPSLEDLVSGVWNMSPVVWSRRPENPEFLCVRMGLGPIPAALRIADQPPRGPRDLLAKLAKVRRQRATVPDAPVIVDLREVGNLGVCGRGTDIVQVASSIALQIVAAHSPAEVVLACITDANRRDRWGWMDWLPHTNSAQSPVPGSLLSADSANARRLLEALDDLVSVRLEDQKKGIVRGPLGDGEPELPDLKLPAVVAVVEIGLADPARLARIAELGPDAGVHLICVSSDQDQLPAACRAFLNVAEDGAKVGLVRRELTVVPITLESVDSQTAMAIARRLAPVVDSSAQVEDDSDLPAAISLVSLTGSDLADNPEAILSHWSENGSLIDRSSVEPVPRADKLSLRAVVGHDGVQPFTLDIRTQGPHALVGGTTGAGKSEFLQAWILGLAQAISPDRLTFLLVDYKGGAAFAHCVKLPHCVGLVTDLSPYLVQRALRSLRAEIHYRENMLNAKSAKDLIELENRGDPECPPNLMIIVDEFAALKMEVPEFVDGVVDIAQRGRSLGLHLVLATQRPAGVIGDNIRANTNLRVALRMNDEPDSKDVIGDPMSAHFDPSLPGRGVARVGPGRLIRFQTAYPGARTSSEPESAPISLDEFSFGVLREWKVPRPTRAGAEVPKDIERVVSTLRKASKVASIPAPRRPWLDGLADAYDLLRLRQRTDQKLVLGVVDDPDKQQQYTEYYYPDTDGNILFIGTGGSGKSTALRSLAAAAGITPRGGPVHVYGLDFAGRSLNQLEVLPHVGSIVPGSDTERVERLIRMLGTELDRRATEFAAVNAANISEYRELSGKPDTPRILVLIDGYGSLEKEYSGSAAQMAYLSALSRVVAEGRAVGIHFAACIDRPGGLSAATASAFQRRVVLRLASENAYMDAGVPKDMLASKAVPGRAILAEEEQEIQLAVVGGLSRVGAQQAALEALGESIRKQSAAAEAPPIKSLPTVVTRSSLPKSRNDHLVVGLSDQTLSALSVPVKGLTTIAGTVASGKTNALLALGLAAREACPKARILHLAPDRSRLAKHGFAHESASGVEECRAAITRANQLLTGASPEVLSLVVLVESLPELSRGGLGPDLLALARAAQSAGQTLIAEGSIDQLIKDYDVFPTLKAAARALVLQPSADDGFTLVGLKLPALRRADMVPGRGFWVERGSAVKLQVPLVE